MKVHLIENSSDFYKLVQRLPLVVGFDIETAGVRSDTTVIGFSVGTETEGWYYDIELNGLPKKGLELLFNTHELVMHNGQFDLIRLWQLGFKKINYKYDSMYIAHLLDSELKLQDLALKKQIREIFKIDTSLYEDIYKNPVLEEDINWDEYFKIMHSVTFFDDKGVFINKYFKKIDNLKRLNNLILKQDFIQEKLYFDIADDEMRIVAKRKMDKDSVNIRANFLFVKKLFNNAIKDNYYKRFWEYGAKDAIYTLKLYKYYEKKVPKDWNRFWNLFFEDMELVKIVAKMSIKGFRFNKDMVLKLKKEYETKVRDLEFKIYKEVGKEFNYSSPLQLKEVLSKRGLELNSTNEKILKKYKDKDKLIEMILEMREYEKLLNTYINGFLNRLSEDGKIRSLYNLVETPTFRFACKSFYKHEGINIQNIPEDMRGCILPDEDYYFIGGDYSGQEVRLLLGFIGNKEIIDRVNNGYDIHCLVASMMYKVPYEKIYNEYMKYNAGEEYDEKIVKLRKIAKSITFGLVYGLGTLALAERLGFKGAEQEKRAFGKKMTDKFYNAIKGIREFKDKAFSFFNRSGYIVDYFGRRRYIRKDGHESTKILNSIIQGSAASMMRKIMIKVYRELQNSIYKDKIRIAINIHDELIFEVHKSVDYMKAIEFLRDLMEVEIMGVKFYTDWAYGEDWGSLKGVSLDRVYNDIGEKKKIDVEQNAGLLILNDDINKIYNIIDRLKGGDCYLYLDYRGDIYEIGFIRDFTELKIELFKNNIKCELRLKK